MQLDHVSATPEWLRSFNAWGRALLGSGAPAVSLDERSLLEEARRNTGLDDFGGDEFIEPLRLLLRSLNEEAELTLMGRLLARSDILNVLENRLQITETFRQHPEIADERVAAPIVVIGLSRSGTSILHELLGQDPAHRVPLSWEVRFPCPPPETATHRTDPRVAQAERVFTFWNELVPAYESMHEMGALNPCECIWLTAHSFICEEWAGRQQVPSYAQWLVEADLSPGYAYHRKLLQLLQWRCPGQRWVLKAPSHMQALDFLLREYPDARVVHTHRDPLQIMGSVASLLSALTFMRSERADPELIRQGFGSEGILWRLERALQVRDSGIAEAWQFCDILYRDLVRDPLETLRSVYTHYGLEFSDAAEQSMRAYLAHKPQGKHGKHAYSFHDLGLDLAQERRRFAGYQERFGVPSEVI